MLGVVIGRVGFFIAKQSSEHLRARLAGMRGH
jgi:hypothetical protein